MDVSYGWMDGWMDGWIDAWTDGWMGWMTGWMNGWMDEWMDWIVLYWIGLNWIEFALQIGLDLTELDELTDGWTDWRMNMLMDVWVDG